MCQGHNNCGAFRLALGGEGGGQFREEFEVLAGDVAAHHGVVRGLLGAAGAFENVRLYLRQEESREGSIFPRATAAGFVTREYAKMPPLLLQIWW